MPHQGTWHATYDDALSNRWAGALPDAAEMTVFPHRGCLQNGLFADLQHNFDGFAFLHHLDTPLKLIHGQHMSDDRIQLQASA